MPKPEKPKSGRLVKFPASAEKPPEEKKLSGWKKRAQENKQRLFENGKTKGWIGSVIDRPVERTGPVIPTKPLLHLKCLSTGMKIVSGRKWPCDPDCQYRSAPTVKFTAGEHATDDEIAAREGYEA